MAKILIIDDSMLSRRMMRKILLDAGHQVVEAGDGFAALEMFSIERPAFVFLDLTMPGLSGFEVLKQLKSLSPSTRVVIASADIQKMTRDQAMADGADAFINKPFIEEEILSVFQT